MALYNDYGVSRSNMCHFLKGPIPDGKDKSEKELSNLYQALHKQKITIHSCGFSNDNYLN